jgi:pilus assembly protein CpaB
MILLIAMAVAGLCAFAVFRQMTRQAQTAKPAATNRVVTASKDIKLGSVLAASDITLTEVSGPAPKGAFVKVEDVVGRGAVAEIFQGEPVLETRLAARGSGGGLAATIPQGMRACAVRVDEVVGVAGFVTAGQRVDVLASGMRSGANMIMPGNPNDGMTSRIILQNIQVLSAGTDIQKDAEGKPKTVQVVNLLVTPEQAETLSLATNQLRIQLVLRNPLDTTVTQVRGMAMSNLMNDEPVATPEPKHASTGGRRRSTAPVVVSYAVEVLNGTNRTEEHVKMPEVKP